MVNYSNTVLYRRSWELFQPAPLQLYTSWKQHPISPSPQPLATSLCSLLLGDYFRYLVRWNYAAFVLLWLFYFTWRKVLKVIHVVPYGSQLPCFLSLDDIPLYLCTAFSFSILPLMAIQDSNSESFGGLFSVSVHIRWSVCSPSSFQVLVLRSICFI